MKKIIALVLVGILIVSTGFASVTNTNEKIREQDDFYTTVNKQWIKESKIPEGSASWGNFEELNNSNTQALKSIVEAYRKQRLPKDSDAKKMVNFYNNLLDYSNRNKDGIAPIQPLLNKVNEIKSMNDYCEVVSVLALAGVDTVYSIGVDVDLKDSKTNVLQVSTAGLGLPSREYYFSEDNEKVVVKKAYKTYLKTLFMLKGDSQKVSQNKADIVFALEKKLAQNIMSTEESSDPEVMYHVMTKNELIKLNPTIDWSMQLATLKFDKTNKIIVTQPKFLNGLEQQLKNTDLKTWRAFLEANILNNYSGCLSYKFEKARFDYSKNLTGVTQMKTKEERAYETVEVVFGEQLGKLYVDQYFSKSSKEDITLMAKDIIRAYEVRISKLDWMTNETKERAIKKLKTMTIKVGYPDVWTNYSGVEINTYQEGASIVQNINNLVKYKHKKMLVELNSEVDKSKWEMLPQEINAYYNPLANEIVFPAGILQEPFYNHSASRAENLGGIGVIIGHEVSHAFDDSGSKFDEKGNLVNWWTDEDLKKYNDKCKKLETQFSNYSILPDVKVNGKLTLGENIADLGGVSVALDVLKNEKLPDYKGFFNKYASIWRNIETVETTKLLNITETHAPGIFRVNGVLTNIDEFYSTFGVTEKDKLYKKPEERIKIW